MKGYLQYCATDDGTYKDGGTLRSIKKDYIISPVIMENRAGEKEDVGYNIKVSAQLINQNADIFDEEEWFWRIKYANDLQMIKLGEHPYTKEFDSQLARNTVKYHKINISFHILFDEYEDYAVPVALPESEGGIIVEDTNIYVE